MYCSYYGDALHQLCRESAKDTKRVMRSRKSKDVCLKRTVNILSNVQS